MIEIVKNNWRPFIKLTALDYVNDSYQPLGVMFYDVTKRPTIVRDDSINVTFIYNGENGTAFTVSETPEEICEAVDKLLDIEAKRQEELAKKNQAIAEQRMADYEAKHNLGAKK